MECLCGCGSKVNPGRRYVNGGHSIKGKIPWNRKYPDEFRSMKHAEEEKK